MWGNSATMVILSLDVSVFSSRGLLVVKGNNPTRVNWQSVGKLLIHTFRSLCTNCWSSRAGFAVLFALAFVNGANDVGKIVAGLIVATKGDKTKAASIHRAVVCG